jgi:hypothetical protein
MLSDPREEQFDLPATTVLLRGRECRQCNVVDQQNYYLAGVGPRETSAPQRTIEAFVRVKSGERHHLSQPSPFVQSTAQVEALSVEIGMARITKSLPASSSVKCCHRQGSLIGAKKQLAQVHRFSSTKYFFADSQTIRSFQIEARQKRDSRIWIHYLLPWRSQLMNYTSIAFDMTPSSRRSAVRHAIALKARRVTDNGQCQLNSHLTDSYILRCAKS